MPPAKAPPPPPGATRPPPPQRLLPGAPGPNQRGPGWGYQPGSGCRAVDALPREAKDWLDRLANGTAAVVLCSIGAIFIAVAVIAVRVAVE